MAGFIGLDFNALIKPYNVTSEPIIVLSYAVPAPNNIYRNARLLVHLAKSKKIIEDAISASKSTSLLMYLGSAKELATVEYSRFDEVKGLRGLMKIRNKKKLAENLNALSYYTPLNNKAVGECLIDWLNKEKEYKNGKK